MMIKKHAILLGIVLSVILLIISTHFYPGGTNFDNTTLGFSWKKNYISNLFGEKAVNGMENGARYWAVAGMMFLSLSFSLFFVQFSTRIPKKGAAKVVKFIGLLSTLCTFLIATPLHDLMVVISSTLILVCIFYITIFVFMSKLHVFKLFCVVYMLFFYGLLYIYGSGDFRPYLPIIQKVFFVSTIILILALHYFVKKEELKISTKEHHVHN